MKKLFIILTSMVCLLCLLCGCAPSAVTPTAAPGFEHVYFPDTDIENNPMYATMRKPASNLAELYEKSATIIYGNVITDDKMTLEKPVPLCYSDIMVLSVIKGNLTDGDIITIEETGNRQANGKDTSIDGVPLLRKNMRVMLFLTDEVTLANEQAGYGIEDVYLGKFISDTFGKLHQSGKLVSGDTMYLSDLTNTVTVDDFFDLINTVKK